MPVAPPSHHRARHQRLREDLAVASLDAVLITALPNIAYLTGLFASAGAVILSSEALWLLVDGRYLSAATARQADLPDLTVRQVPLASSLDEAIIDLVCSLGQARVGFEAHHMSVRQHRDLSARLAARGARVELEAVDGMVEARRMVKGRLGAADHPRGRR